MIAVQTWVPPLLTWLYVLAIVAALLTVLTRKREPASVLGWSLALIFVPVGGLLLFLLFGTKGLPRRLRRKIEHHGGFVSPFPSAAEVGGELFDAGHPPDDRWGALGQLLEDLEDAPRRHGNRVEIFPEGILAFQRMAEAVEEAREHVHVEFFIFRDDDLGREAIDRLCRRAREGVEVRVLVDALGSFGGHRMLRRLRGAGAQAQVFLPFRPLGKRITPNLRNHRKIVVCDGRAAFFGGLNVGVEYLGRYGRAREWFDLHAELRGPSVWDLQRIFVEDWDFATGQTLEGLRYFPATRRAGPSTVQIIAGGPDQDVNPIHQAFFGAFTRARRRIQIATPYLVPDLSLREGLLFAARSGVEVTILTQWPPADHYVTQLCGEWTMYELLEAGVQILGYRPGMMHAKAVTIDGEWGMIGTANLDNRSLQLNFEQMAILDRPADVRELEAALAPAFAHGEPYTLEGLASRPLARRVLSGAARLLAPVL